MGRLDQFAKQTFADETPLATANALSFEVPAETSLLKYVRADGVLRVCAPAVVATLPLPWSLAHAHEFVCVELKMQGDHLDFAMVQRALLRRQALEVLRTEADRTRVRPDDLPLRVVAAILPEWVHDRYALVPLGPGVWRVGSLPLVWVASNELGLRDDLVPFLVSRTGGSLADFVRWVAPRRPPQWVLDMLQIIPMSPNALAELLTVIPNPTDDPEIQERRRLIARTWLEVVTPEIKQEFLDKGIEEGHEKGREEGLGPLRHQFERKLGRAMTDAERKTLHARLEALGPDSVGDVVLDLDGEALGAWLRSPSPAK